MIVSEAYLSHRDLALPCRRGRLASRACVMTANIPLCPRCREKMRLCVVAPVMLAETVDHFSYVCKECGTEEIHDIKR
jgi:hypothetical protein